MACKTKKTPKKKIALMPVARPTAKKADESCGCGCGCMGGGMAYGWPHRRGGFWHWIGKALLMILFFCLVWCTMKFGFILAHHGRPGMMGNRPQLTFDAKGCLDTTAIKCPMMLQKVQSADANKDGCITRDELRAAWKDMRGGMMGDRPGMDDDCGM